MPECFSPRIIVHKENLDYNEHLEFALRECVQALNKPKKTSTNTPRILDCLLLHPNTANQGRRELLHLPTIKIIIQ